ncbi:hypothetical protein [Cellulomonas sp. C5510]|uniref:hypothetical protein n=1 Tax=Cellulomonas sp. C5510 TaxID=2871170 RepID=UPI001C98B79C|nr:hypothetical protein [Cellulomonas sp. C5510]QZN86906.1 hypothetical protein K5O09_07285 [Cellulomonas sp. C5510]
MTANDVVAALAAATLTYTDEVSLHEDMSRVLAAAGIEHEREVRLTPHDRIDFLTAGGVGIEVKVAGSLVAVTRQMQRYAHHDDVHSLVLVTTRAVHHGIPTSLGGVPVELYSLIGQGL